MVKQGYKQTEIGVIPEDWTVVSVGDIAKDMADGPFGSNLKKVHYTTDKQARIVQLSNIGENGWENENVKYTTFSHAKKISRCIVEPGQIIMAKMMPAGRAIICPENEKMYILGSDSIKIDIDDSIVNAKYFMYSTKSKMFQEQIKEDTQGSTRVRTSISKLRKNSVVIPTICEQECIANALSDMDAMISSFEKLIAKKKAIKQGAMKALLTGKIRLSGFTGEWIEKKLEDIVIRFATGLNPRQNFKLNDGGINYYVTIKDFKNGKLFLGDECDRIDDVALARINERSDLRRNDLLFSSIGRIGDAYLITETPRNWNINESVFSLRPNQLVVYPLMLYYLLTSEDVKSRLLDNTTGSTIKSIKLGHLKEVICRFPKDINEQMAIATILSEMDNEIEALEQKLTKIRQLKQGMMQQLLTGKIRLI